MLTFMLKCEVTSAGFIFRFESISTVSMVMPNEVCHPTQTPSAVYSNQNKAALGTDAIEGEIYNIRGAILFRPTPYDREITGKGDSIMVYDPNADMDSPPYWENDDPSKEETSPVPAGFEIRVIGAVVIFKRV